MALNIMQSALHVECSARKLKVSQFKVSVWRFMALQPLPNGDVIMLLANLYAVLSVANKDITSK